MDHLWSPWRYTYVTQPGPAEGCFLCDRQNLILFRGQHNFIVLNSYPYTAGHLMIAPYAHVATLEDTEEATASEMMKLTRLAQRHLREIYRAPGFNLGMNIGACAGAGVAGHIHMHLLPRWPGDVNFMTTIGETRVIPEDLATTYEKLSKAFER